MSLYETRLDYVVLLATSHKNFLTQEGIGAGTRCFVRIGISAQIWIGYK